MHGEHLNANTNAWFWTKQAIPDFQSLPLMNESSNFQSCTTHTQPTSIKLYPLVERYEVLKTWSNNPPRDRKKRAGRFLHYFSGSAKVWMMTTWTRTELWGATPKSDKRGH
jgi:hypothetical protein